MLLWVLREASRKRSPTELRAYREIKNNIFLSILVNLEYIPNPDIKMLISKTGFCFKRYFTTVLSLIEAGIVSSLILGRSDLRGFCLFIFMKNVFDYRQNNPLKHNAGFYLL
jgi:hypothetical protein